MESKLFLRSQEATLYYVAQTGKCFSVYVQIFEELQDFVVKAVDINNSRIYFSEMLNCSNYIIRDDRCHEVFLTNDDQLLLQYENNDGYKEFINILENCFERIEKKERLNSSELYSRNTSSLTKELEDYSISELIPILEYSMAIGDGPKASQVAFQLAVLHAHCKINSINQKEDLIILHLYFEDLNSHVGPFEFKALPSSTIGELKNQVYETFNFPVNIQRWIIGRELTEDDSTLENYDVTISDCPIFIYLLSKKSLSRLESMTKRPVRKRSRTSTTSNSEKDLIVDKKTPTEVNGEARVEIENEIHQGATINNPDVLDQHLILSSLTALLSINTKHKPGWQCPLCTMFNKPLRPGCEACGTERPDDYNIPQTYEPDEEEQRWCQQDEESLDQFNKTLQSLSQNIYQDLQVLDEQQYVVNPLDFACPVCFADIIAGLGLCLRTCTHSICKECFHQMVITSNEPVIKCPYANCFGEAEEREIAGIVTEKEFDDFKNRGLKLAELQNTNSYHCQSPNCHVWVELVLEDKVNEFICMNCQEINCISCRAIHKNLNCIEYQRELQEKALHDENARKTLETLNELLNTGKAMKCPTCTVILQRKEGCDWIMCTMCKTEICWVTKGPRWGPKGTGDNSGGCQCGVGGVKCHIDCINCH